MPKRAWKSVFSSLVLLLASACETYQFGSSSEVRDAVLIDNAALPLSASGGSVGYTGPEVYGPFNLFFGPCHLYGIQEPESDAIRHQIRFGSKDFHDDKKDTVRIELNSELDIIVPYIIVRDYVCENVKKECNCVLTYIECEDDYEYDFETCSDSLDPGWIDCVGSYRRCRPHWERDCDVCEERICGNKKILAVDIDGDDLEKFRKSGLLIESRNLNRCFFSPEYIEGYLQAIRMPRGRRTVGEPQKEK